MIYMMAHLIALENFFAKELASVPMCLNTTCWKYELGRNKTLEFGHVR
jgi:hypothetical protein